MRTMIHHQGLGLRKIYMSLFIIIGLKLLLQIALYLTTTSYEGNIMQAGRPPRKLPISLT